MHSITQLEEYALLEKNKKTVVIILVIELFVKRGLTILHFRLLTNIAIRK